MKCREKYLKLTDLKLEFEQLVNLIMFTTGRLGRAQYKV